AYEVSRDWSSDVCSSDLSDSGDGTSVFAVSRETQGITETPNIEMDHTTRTSTVTFDNVTVAADDVIGEVDKGWDVIGPTLQRAEIGRASCRERVVVSDGC